MVNGIRQAAIILTAVVIAVGAMAGIAENPTQISDEQLFAAMDLDRAGLEEVAGAVEQGDFQRAAAAWTEYFRIRTRPQMHFDRERWAELLREHFPQLAGPVIGEADEIARGNISHGTMALSATDGEIDWFSNPTRDTNYVSMVGSQWFWQPVGRAYLLTGDDRYVEAFDRIFSSWYENRDEISRRQGNLGFEPIWRAYYPGVQTRVLCDAYYCLGTSERLKPQVHLKVLKQILGACSWLYAQERSYRKGNQQVAAVVGLGVAGRMLPEFRAARDWVELAETRMAEHLEHDFYADGGHREICTQYHKTVLRDVSYVGLVATANGEPGLFGDPETMERLQRAYEWLLKIVTPTLETPPLHSAVFASDWAVYALIGAREFGRGDFRWLADRFWAKGLVPNQKMPVGFANYLLCERLFEGDTTAPKPPDYESVLLDASGFAVMREGRKPDDRYLIFQYGQGNTGHAYPGALSFLLQQNGELIATHPGSPRSYRHPAYEYCKSTRAHNVVSIDLEDQPREGGIAPGGELEAYSDEADAWYVQASCEGYAEPFEATLRRRILVIRDGPVLIHDRVEGAAGHTAHWNLHTPLAVTNTKKALYLSGQGKYTLKDAYGSRISAVRKARRWMAVRAVDCQPEDCGTEVNVVRLEKDIPEGGVTYCVAILQGDGQIHPAGKNRFEITDSTGSYAVRFGEDSAAVERLEGK